MSRATRCVDINRSHVSRSDVLVPRDLCLKASVFESSREGIVIASEERIIVAANEAFVGLSGYSIAELVGMNVDAMRSKSLDVEKPTEAWPQIPVNERWVGKTLYRKKNGEEHPIELSIVAVRDDSSGATFYTYTCADVASRDYAEARIQHMAFFDALTGLPNRAYLTKRFESMTTDVGTSQRMFAVVFLDLDGFKEINDTFGHSAGDAMIVQLAQRLSADASGDTLVCRFGGDEFIIVLADYNEARATQFIRGLLVRISQPISLEGRDIAVTASAGISTYPRDGNDVESLVRYADTALYYAKSNGKNTVVNFSPEMAIALSRRFDLLAALRSAIDRDEFVLRFQPIMDAAKDIVVGAEALVYWEHPKFGTIGPSTFIPLAEESGLIEAVGEWVINEALANYAMWESRGLPKLGLAINVSGFQVRRLETIEQIISNAVAAGVIDPRRLTLEITERHVVHNLKSGLPVLQALSARGVGLAIDDFGTGYSNLNYLKTMPITEIKIDISFIRNMVRDMGDRVIVKAIIDLSRSLRLGVVAEGVETAEQLEILTEYGCNRVQGYLFSRPLQTEAFVDFVLRYAEASDGTKRSFPVSSGVNKDTRADRGKTRRRSDKVKDQPTAVERRVPVSA
jgi:diguanylate cyclase (GGDEF)-like protein/PAS domain S-box-containing protein